MQTRWAVGKIVFEIDLVNVVAGCDAGVMNHGAHQQQQNWQEAFHSVWRIRCGSLFQGNAAAKPFGLVPTRVPYLDFGVWVWEGLIFAHHFMNSYHSLPLVHGPLDALLTIDLHHILLGAFCCPQASIQSL